MVPRVFAYKGEKKVRVCRGCHIVMEVRAKDGGWREERSDDATDTPSFATRFTRCCSFARRLHRSNADNTTMRNLQCDSLRLSQKGRTALLMGEIDTAMACVETENINLQSPYTIYEDSMYPIHCAAYGGSLDLLKYLVDSKGCYLTYWKENGDLPATKEPYLTRSRQTVMSIAANRGESERGASRESAIFAA